MRMHAELPCHATASGSGLGGVDRKPRLLAREPHGADEVPQLPVLSAHKTDWVQGMPAFLGAFVHVDGDDLADEQVVATEVQGLAHDALDVEGALRHQRHGCGRSLFAGESAQLPLVRILAGHHAAEVEFPGVCNIRHVDDEGASLDLSLIHISEPTRLGMISYAV